MNNKRLFEKLNSFKNIKPNNEWKSHCRDILLSQISNGQTVEELEQKKLFNLEIFFGDIFPQWINIKKMKTVCVGFSVIILLVGCGFTGVYASRNAKLGDSLYIAKIISEKAQFAITFDEKEKTKLNLEFATNRAEEINQLSKESVATEVIKQDQNKKAQKLTSNFKKEIDQAKSRINKINITNAMNNKIDDGQQVFGASLGKDNKQIEISEPINANKNIIDKQQPIEATPNAANKIIEEAEKLFNEKNYIESINKLKEVNEAIGQVADNVPLVQTQASTTIDVK